MPDSAACHQRFYFSVMGSARRTACSLSSFTNLICRAVSESCVLVVDCRITVDSEWRRRFQNLANRFTMTL